MSDIAGIVKAVAAGSSISEASASTAKSGPGMKGASNQAGLIAAANALQAGAAGMTANARAAAAMAQAQSVMSGAANSPKAIATLSKTQKMMFLSVVSGALDRASGNHAFQLDAAVQDLTMKLNALRADKSKIDKINQDVAGDAMALQKMQEMIDMMNQGSSAMIQKIK